VLSRCVTVPTQSARLLIIDLGSGFGRAEAFVDGTHFDSSRTRCVRQASLHVLMRRG